MDRNPDLATLRCPRCHVTPAAAAAVEQAQLARMVEQSHNSVMLLDPAGRFRWVNRAFERRTGFTINEVRGRTPREVLRVSVANPVHAAEMDAALALGRDTQVQLTQRSKDGHFRDVEVVLNALRDEAGGLQGFAVTERDISELVQQRGLASAMLRAMPAGVVVRNAQGIIVEVNPAAEKIIGRSRAELIGYNPSDVQRTLVAMDNAAPVEVSLPSARTLATGEVLHNVPLYIRRPDGERRAVHVSTAPLHDATGNINGVLSCLADNTELLAQRTMLSVAQSAAPILPWHWDVEHDRAEFDARTAIALGMARPDPDIVDGQVLTLSLWNTVHRDDRGAIEAAIERHLHEPESPYRAEFRLADGKGLWRWVLAAGAATERGADGQALRIAGVLLDITERKASEAALQRAATTDDLTGLPNRATLHDRLDRALASAKRHRHCGALMFIDLDRFKRINDTLGHAAGDALLKALGQRLAGQLRAEDTLARMGGDEWMVLLPKLGDDEAAAHAHARLVADKLIAALQAPFTLAHGECQIGASVGITVFPKSAQEAANDLVREADTAMYEAKSAGRGGTRHFEAEMLRSAVVRYETERALQQALEHGQFSLALQPQWRADRVLHGAEVLLRWSHPERGAIPPAEFIPVAEDCGLIVPIGQWVLRQACELAAKLRRQGTPLRLAVNVSPRQFREAGFVAELTALLAETGALARDLTLEFTEGLLIDDIDGASRRMGELAQRGFRLSIDDFGTGYSSLMYLKRLPIQELKIDRGFVRDVTVDADDDAIVEAILAIAQRFGIDTVAEGVETEAQAAFLTGHGCTLLQGYLLGRPVPVQEFLARWCELPILTVGAG